jgi:hypothetical protein
MSIHAFNINNCGIKSSGSSGKDTKEDLEFLEVAEFTVVAAVNRGLLQVEQELVQQAGRQVYHPQRQTPEALLRQEHQPS